MVPHVKNIQKNVKLISKSDECPEEFAVDIATVIYFSSIYVMQSFERVKAQFGFRYGQKFVDRIIAKHKGVDEEVYSNINYKVDKQELKDRTKDLSSISKKRVKEEAKIIQDSNAALAEGITSLPSTLMNRGSAASSRKGKYDSDDDSDYSEEYSEESSEEEKPKKKAAKKDKKAKKAKKESSSEESESYSEEYSEESSEEEKPKKKAAKKAAKKVKEGKVKVAEETDSDDDTPAAAEPVKEPAKEPVKEAAEEPAKPAEEPAKEAAAEKPQGEAPEVAKEENKQ